MTSRMTEAIWASSRGSMGRVLHGVLMVPLPFHDLCSEASVPEPPECSLAACSREEGAAWPIASARRGGFPGRGALIHPAGKSHAEAAHMANKVKAVLIGG